ncbi:MAG TPA: hypothetical protein VGF08_05835 [Terriglobales bacterium]|jgi:hypothetical protein
MRNAKLHFDEVAIETVKHLAGEEVIAARAEHLDSGIRVAKSENPRYVADFAEKARSEAMGSTSSGESEEFLQYPEWQKAYHDALIEIDPYKLKAKIAVAEAVIFSRQHTIPKGWEQQAEIHAMDDALAFLRTLKRDVLGSLDGDK